MSFMTLLKKYRSREKMTKVALAKAIKKTDAYVRKLENDGYTPPVYKVCHQLADAFNLTDDERTEFLHQAFLGRVKSEKDFLAYLYPDKKPTRPKQNQSVKAATKSNATKVTLPTTLATAGNYKHQCVFQISWGLQSEKQSLDSEAIALLDQQIFNYNDKFNVVTHAVSVSEHEVSMTVSIPPTLAPSEFIESLKTHTSEKLRSNYPKTFSQKQIWAKHSTLVTIGEVKTAKSTTSASAVLVNK